MANEAENPEASDDAAEATADSPVKDDVALVKVSPVKKAHTLVLGTRKPKRWWRTEPLG